MRYKLVLIFCFITGFLLISCVTTAENTNDKNIVTEGEKSIEKADISEDTVDKKGLIYTSRGLSEGPLLLGSKEYMSGPVAEFSILYTISVISAPLRLSVVPLTANVP